MKNTHKSASETDARLRRYRTIEKYWSLLGWFLILLIVAGIVMIFLGHAPGIVSIAVVLGGAIVVYLRLTLLTGTIRRVYDGVVTGVLESAFEQVAQYDSRGHIDSYIVRHTEMGLPAFHNIQGADLIKARYRGIVFAWSNLALIWTGPTAAGGTRKTRTAVFSGSWFAIQTARSYPAALTVSTASKSQYTRRGTILQSGNTEFDSRFSLWSTTPEQAAVMITPQLMKLAEAIAERHGDVHLHLSPNGMLHLAIPAEKPLFLKNASEEKTLMQDYRQDVAFITDSMDLLIEAGWMLSP